MVEMMSWRLIVLNPCAGFCFLLLLCFCLKMREAHNNYSNLWIGSVAQSIYIDRDRHSMTTMDG